MKDGDLHLTTSTTTDNNSFATGWLDAGSNKNIFWTKQNNLQNGLVQYYSGVKLDTANATKLYKWSRKIS